MVLSCYCDLKKLNLEGKYYNIRISEVEDGHECDEANRNCVDFWSRCGKYVKELTVCLLGEDTEIEATLSLLVYLKDVLPNTPNLKKLSLSGWGEIPKPYCWSRRGKKKYLKIIS